MNSHSASTPASGPNRRAVATGLAWSVPAVAMVSAAPSFAVSLRKDPGINGLFTLERGVLLEGGSGSVGVSVGSSWPEYVTGSWSGCGTRGRCA